MVNIVSTDREIMGGTPVFAGTRVPVEVLFQLLERGRTIDYFLEQFPTVQREQALGLLQQACSEMKLHAVPSEG